MDGMQKKHNVPKGDIVLNIKKYEAFVRAVELGSLSKASEELGYTQSGISHMMQSLEDEVGFPLMVRTSAGIVPNNEGEMLLPIIRQLLSTNESLEQYIAKIKGADTGRIRIAAFPSVATYWLPHIIRRFLQDFPDVDIQLYEDTAESIENIMAGRKADMCLYTGGLRQPFEWYPLWRDQVLALVPPDHPLTERDSVSVADLRTEQIIMPTAGYEYAVDNILSQLKQPRISLTSTNDFAMISMVVEGLGIAIMPELILRNYRNDAVAIPLDPPQYRTIGMGIPQVKTASPVTRNFMKYVQDYVRDLKQDKG